MVDCANGIGAAHLQMLSQHLQMSGFNMTAMCTGAGILNGGCGADYIQKERAMPHSFESVPDGSRYFQTLFSSLVLPSLGCLGLLSVTLASRQKCNLV